tara:strand:- start:74 stop:310 length:237 start_codon:yes stop_codon:yes gene_type:complete
MGASLTEILKLDCANLQCGQKTASIKSGLSRMNDEYDWAEDAIASYDVAIQTLRERYLENCLPSESAKEWLERASSGE